MFKSRCIRPICKIIVAFMLITLLDRKSDAFLIGNLIGCNSFGCRLTNLENEVSQLKQQVVRLGSDSGLGMNNGMNSNNGMNQFRPNQNPNQLGGLNSNLQGSGLPNTNGNLNNQANQNQNQNQPNNRVNFANYEYPTNNNELRRVQSYPPGNQQVSNQFF